MTKRKGTKGKEDSTMTCIYDSAKTHSPTGKARTKTSLKSRQFSAKAKEKNERKSESRTSCLKIYEDCTNAKVSTKTFLIYS